CFAVGMGDVVHAVLQDLNFVGFFHQGVATHTDLALAGSGHFVVVHFNHQAHGFHGVTHGTTDFVQGVDRGNREITALDAGTVTGVGVVEILMGNPGGFFGVNGVHGTVDVGAPFHGVEDEELGLRTKHGGVGDTGGLQVLFRATGNGARVALIALHIGGVD